MSKQNQIRQPKLIIVEGNHERDFFNAWLKTLKRTDIQVMSVGGKTTLRRNLKALIKQAAFPTVSHILVVRDADENPSGAFQSVYDALKNAGLAAPNDVLTFTEGTTPQIAIVIVPGGDELGALEELLLTAASNDPLAGHANQFIEDAIATLNRTGTRRPPPPHRRGKAKIHVYLATFERPDRDAGKAALAGVWDFEHVSLASIKNLLHKM